LTFIDFYFEEMKPDVTRYVKKICES